MAKESMQAMPHGPCKLTTTAARCILAIDLRKYKSVDKLAKLIADKIGQTWMAMEALVTTGRCGTSASATTTVHCFGDLLSYATIAPAVLQIELHPYRNAGCTSCDARPQEMLCK
jgi:diketogulonate reductase-like aldo/keto reductase